MKKVFFAAAAMLLMVVATSCEEGKCACKGSSTGGGTVDILNASKKGGYSDKMVCDDIENSIKAQYPNAAYVCYPGKTEDDIK